jgi:hypothetical protein
MISHLTFIERYASTERFLRYQHENAYLLGKGNPYTSECRPPMAAAIKRNLLTASS